MQEATEQQIQKAISDYLKLKKVIIFKHRNVGIYKKDTGKYIPLSYGERGISDLIGCTNSGRFIAVEVKRKGGKATEDQISFLERIKQAGGIAFLAHSIDDVVEETKDIL